MSVRFASMPEPLVLPAATREVVDVRLRRWPDDVTPSELTWLVLLSTEHDLAPPDGPSPAEDDPGWTGADCLNVGTEEAPQYRLKVPVADLEPGHYGVWARVSSELALSAPVRWLFALHIV